jgi:hypothetical protein
VVNVGGVGVRGDGGIKLHGASMGERLRVRVRGKSLLLMMMKNEHLGRGGTRLRRPSVRHVDLLGGRRADLAGHVCGLKARGRGAAVVGVVSSGEPWCERVRDESRRRLSSRRSGRSRAGGLDRCEGVPHRHVLQWLVVLGAFFAETLEAFVGPVKEGAVFAEAAGGGEETAASVGKRLDRVWAQVGVWAVDHRARAVILDKLHASNSLVARVVGVERRNGPPRRGGFRGRRRIHCAAGESWPLREGGRCFRLPASEGHRRGRQQMRILGGGQGEGQALRLPKRDDGTRRRLAVHHSVWRAEK